jgi:hypothetical protein
LEAVGFKTSINTFKTLEMKAKSEMKQVKGFKQPIGTPDAERIGGGAPAALLNPKIGDNANKFVNSLKRRK